MRALSGPYGLATVTGPDVVTPVFLIDLARRLWRSGNAVYLIDVDEQGLSLLPASGFDVGGSGRNWKGRK